MKVLQFAFAFLAIRTSYASLFGVDSSWNANSTTRIPHLHTLDTSISESFAAETYEVFNLSMAEIPPAYLSYMQLEKRDWKADVAFAVVGGAVAATRLANSGARWDVLNRRVWKYEENLQQFPDEWKRMQVVTSFNILMAYVDAVLRGSIAGFCAGRAGNWAFGTTGNGFISGASREEKNENRFDEDRKGFVEKWVPGSSRKHDELKKRAP